jgi:hypothetical protein
MQLQQTEFGTNICQSGIEREVTGPEAITLSLGVKARRKSTE